MAIISSAVLIRSHALILLTSAYYLLTSPLQLLNSTPIWLLGESMLVRPAQFAIDGLESTSSALTFSKSAKNHTGEREILALLGLLLAMYALLLIVFAGELSLPAPPSASRAAGENNLKSASKWAEEVHTLLSAQSRWMTLAGLHVLGSSVTVAWIYLFHTSQTAQTPVGKVVTTEGSLREGLGLLANSITFSTSLANMLFNGYLVTVIRDEGRQVGNTLARRREVEEDDD